jgi:hypothetical protein
MNAPPRRSRASAQSLAQADTARANPSAVESPFRWALALPAVFALSACGTLTDLGDRAVLQPLGQVARAVGLGAGSATDACTRAASPVNPATLAPGLGGTGAPATAVAAHPGGIGGTGQVAQRPGLGGTGQVADSGLGGTGIVGVVTGFGSICVNGLKVEYAPETPLQRAGQPVPHSTLAVGQVVALQAVEQGPRLQAGRIAVLDAAVGPLGAVDPATGRFTVLGEAATALVPADLASLKPGQWVRVSGQRLASGEIRATRVQATPPGNAWVAGTLSRTATGDWQVGRTPLAADSAILPAASALGQEVGVYGVWTGERLQASAVQLGPTRAALGPVNEVLLQGYVHGVNGRELTLGFETLTLGNVLKVLGGQLDALRSGQPVLVRGQRDARQRLVVDRLEFRKEGGRGGSQSASSSRRSGRDDSDDSKDGDDSDSGSSGSGSSSSGSGSGSGGDSGGQGRGRGRGRGGD